MKDQTGKYGDLVETRARMARLQVSYIHCASDLVALGTDSASDVSQFLCQVAQYGTTRDLENLGDWVWPIAILIFYRLA